MTTPTKTASASCAELKKNEQKTGTPSGVPVSLFLFIHNLNLTHLHRVKCVFVARGFYERLPPGGSWRRRRLKEPACTKAKHSQYGENYSLVTRSPSTAIAVPRLAAARSRSRFDSPPDCHSLRSRRFATSRREALGYEVLPNTKSRQNITGFEKSFDFYSFTTLI